MNKRTNSFIIYILLFIAVLLIVISPVAPFVFTSFYSGIVFTETGQIGDTIGGIMNPFIGISAVIVTGLAFYMQYQANDLVRKQFEIQKFENQFYEMLRIHQKNVEEFNVNIIERPYNPIIYIDKKEIKGRDIFLGMKKQFEWLLETFNIHNSPNKKLSQEEFTYLYNLFFWGKNYSDKFKINTNNKWIEEIKRMNHLKNEHHSYLGHYYRHLFYIVKFVVVENKNLISEEEKRKYLKILRNQMSNYEQIMLFYNWLSGYGDAWENKDNQFFTKYKMIHNLWYDQLYGDEFIKEKIEYLNNAYKTLNNNDNLFEIDDIS